MGGAIAQLIARDHPEVVAGLVLSGTAQHWQEDELRRTWKLMPLVGFGLSVAPGRCLALRLQAGRSRARRRRRVDAFGDDASQRPGHRRGRPRARALRLATLAAPAAGANGGRCDHRDDAVPPAKQLAARRRAGRRRCSRRRFAIWRSRQRRAAGVQPGAVARRWTRPVASLQTRPAGPVGLRRERVGTGSCCCCPSRWSRCSCSSRRRSRSRTTARDLRPDRRQAVTDAMFIVIAFFPP